MKGEVDPNVILDYVIFNIISRQNRFEASICSKEKIEKVASGPLDLLELHLPLVKAYCPDLSDYFRLELPENLKGSSWFTKSTLARFLHLVNVPDLLETTTVIQNELNQLEGTRKFHVTLYTKDKQATFGDFPAESWCLNEVGTTQNAKLETGSSDATKNELLRALDLRVMALNQELATIFNRALGNCSKIQISNLTAFVEHFGASELRNSLVKFSIYFRSELTDTSNEQSELVSHDLKNYNGERIEDRSTLSSQIDSKNAIKYGISPAKIAQAEGQSSSESDESSYSSEEVQSFVERSRPAIRSASPRRSASPMRRIQIGRSGSRRSTALTIKSLSYFPARERPLFNKEDENNSEDESSNPQPKKSENAVLRMSVQDRINLFESKQRDQTSDTQKKNLTTEASFGAKKSVLRRWSAGMGDSSILYPHESTSDDNKVQLTSSNAEISQDKFSAEETSDIQKPSCEQVENAADVLSLEVEDTSSSPLDIPTTFDTPQSEETHNRAVASAEWTRQKEAELNQMLMKMMENKSAKYTSTMSGNIRKHDSGEQKGNSYSQYKAKREEKLRSENTGKRVEKEVKSKVVRDKMDNKKAFVSSKVAGVGGKQDSSAYSQKTRRNSSPPVLPKASISNPAAAKKSSPKTPTAATPGRNSCPSIPSPRTAGTPTSKTSSCMTNSTIPNRRKPQPTPSPTRAALRTERPRQLKGSRGSVTENKSGLKAKNETKPKTVARSSKNIKTKSIVPPGDDSGASPAKPSFYNKVTKKSSIVPLESKPFLRKGTGTGSGVGPVTAKTKSIQPEDLSKNSAIVMQTEKESASETVKTMTEPQEKHLIQLSSVDISLEEPVNADMVAEKTQASEPLVAEVEHTVTQSVEFPAVDLQADDESGISSSAWVEIDNDNDGDPGPLESDLPQITTLADAMPATVTSPRVRHSLSQMLRAESIEPEIIEWGNAEIPPALVYQKDAPRGLKRLLKFARKNKGESNMTGFSSPSVFSDGEEDAEEPRMINKRNTDASLKKAAVKAKATGMHRTMLSESYDGGHPSKGSANHLGNHEFLSASMNGLPSGPHKLREGRSIATSTSAKATRSFFSLSTFRSNKSSETKLR